MMKTLFAIEHPDGSDVEVTAILKGDNVELVEMLEVEVIEMPTDEEMWLQGDKYYMAIPKNQPNRECDIAFIRGAAWMRNKILKP